MKLRHYDLSPLALSYVTKLPTPTADQLQHCNIKSTYDSLCGLATTSTPPVKPMYCTIRTSIIQLSLSINDDHTNYRHQSSSCLSTNDDLVHVRLTVWTSNHSNIPWLNQSTAQLGHLSSSCLSLSMTIIPITDIDHPTDSSNNNNSVTYDK